MMWDINDSVTLGELKSKAGRAARKQSVQATGQAMVLLADVNRRLNSGFVRELTRRDAFLAPSSGYGGEGISGKTSLWAKPLYFNGKQKADDSSLTTVDADWYGAAFGAAYAPSDRFAWGLGLHFMSGDLDGGSDYDADSDAWGLDAGFAANPRWGSFKPLFTAAFHATFHDLDQTRRGGDDNRYHSSPDARVTTLALAMSHDFNLTGDTLVLRPRLGLDWTRTKMDGYDESARAGSMALSMDKERFDSLRSDLGAALLWSPAETLDLEVRAGWLHEWRDTSPLLTTRVSNLGWSLATPANDTSREAAALGASVAWSPNESLTLSLDYDATIGEHLRGHSVAGTFRWDF